MSQGQIWANSNELNLVVNALARTSSSERLSARGGKVPSLLTKREAGIVRLVAEGLTNRDISQQLNLSEHTVRNYLFRIFNKVGISSRLELALYDVGQREETHAVRHGLKFCFLLRRRYVFHRLFGSRSRQICGPFEKFRICISANSLLF